MPDLRYREIPTESGDAVSNPQPASPHDSLTTGERLNLLRRRKKLSLRELADDVGVHWTTLARYERGEMSPTGEVIRSLALALETSADYLLRLKATPSFPTGQNRIKATKRPMAQPYSGQVPLMVEIRGDRSTSPSRAAPLPRKPASDVRRAAAMG
jgi:transcriptional regulator with XRE-family HTH domain